MSHPMIKVEHLSKQYKIGVSRTYKTFQDAITGAFKSPFSLFFIKNNDNKNFLALKDVSFEVEEGEVVGIIGRNGAGKSTLLKILSRITEPTEGKITMRGRAASLLEVGTGFHPELTGRENIYLNGSIMGMTKREIDAKFDEIVKFAEIEKFLDTPVKRYSSGMYVRLAFAVAAHLEPEILLVDEVLAVGDAAFQKKCLGKMKDVSSKEGRTVLFVSHQMTAIKALCNEAVLLDSGQIIFKGEVSGAIDKYLKSSNTELKNIPIAERKRESKCSLRAKIVGFTVINDDGENPEFIDSKKPFTVCLKVISYSDNTKCSAQLIIADEMQNLILLDSGTMQNKIYSLKKGINEMNCQINPLNLYAGDYKINCVLSLPSQEVIDYVPDAYLFSIQFFDPYNIGYNLQKSYGFGLFHVHHEWG